MTSAKLGLEIEDTEEVTFTNGAFKTVNGETIFKCPRLLKLV
jgi:hypothetical protein